MSLISMREVITIMFGVGTGVIECHLFLAQREEYWTRHGRDQNKPVKTYGFLIKGISGHYSV